MFRRAISIVVTLTAAVIAPPAFAAALLFDFNSVTLSGGTGNNGAVQAYFDTVAPGLVKVYGAVADQAYSGDGFALKDPNNDPNKGRFVTLGTTDGATSATDYTAFHTGYDTFIRNIGGGGTPNTPWGTFNGSTVDKFVLVLSAPIYSLSFDWEVFPDGACSNTCKTTDATYPDFGVLAGLQGALNPTYTFQSIGAGGDFPGITTYGSNKYPQGMGHFETAFAKPVTRVEFLDWPATIAIDRLDPIFVPEPATLPLMGLALVGLSFMRRKTITASHGSRT